MKPFTKSLGVVVIVLSNSHKPFNFRAVEFQFQFRVTIASYLLGDLRILEVSKSSVPTVSIVIAIPSVLIHTIPYAHVIDVAPHFTVVDYVDI